MTSDTLVRTRGFLMGGAGMICLAYGLLVIVLGRPDPMHPLIPGLAGLSAAVAIYSAFWGASSDARRQASDEGFRSEMNVAVKVGFWVGMLLFPAFAPFLIAGLTSFEVAFAAIGTLMAAAYLLVFAKTTLRGL